MITKWDSNSRKLSHTYWSGKGTPEWNTLNSRTIICEKTGTISNSFTWLQTSQTVSQAERMARAAAREINKYKNNQYIMFTLNITAATLSDSCILSHFYGYIDTGTEYTYSWDRTGGTDTDVIFYSTLADVGTVVSITGGGLTQRGLTLAAGSSYVFKCDKSKMSDSYTTLRALSEFPFNIAGYFSDSCAAGDSITVEININGSDT